MTIIVRDDFPGSGNIDPSKWSDASTTFYRGSTATHWMKQAGGFATAPFVLGSIPWRVSTFTANVDGNPFTVTYDATNGVLDVGVFVNPGAPAETYASRQFKIDGTPVGSPIPAAPLDTLLHGFPHITLGTTVRNSHVAYAWAGGGDAGWYNKTVLLSHVTTPIFGGIDSAATNAIYNNGYIYGTNAVSGFAPAVIVRIVAPGGVPTNTIDATYTSAMGNFTSVSCAVGDDGTIWVKDSGAGSPGDIALLHLTAGLTLIHSWTFAEMPANWNTVSRGIVSYKGMIAVNILFGGIARAFAAYAVDPVTFLFTLVGHIPQSSQDLVRFQNGLVLGDDGVVSLDPPISNGKGEAVTVPAPGAANQYIEAGMPATLGSILAPPGAMLIGLRLTGGSGAIEGITAQFAPNPDGVTSNFKLSQTHSGIQTYFGPGAGGVNVATPAGYTARIEAIDTSVALKVNGATVIAGTTTVSQEGEGYFALENDTVDSVNGSNDRIDYIEYGVFGSDIITVTNNVGVSGGGSPPASAIDVTNIVTTPSPDGRMFFALDTNGSGDGQHLQRVNNVTMAVQTRLAISTGSGVIGGVMDPSRMMYIPVTGSPSKVWKVDGNLFTEVGLQTLGPPAINPYPVLDLAGNAYFVTYAAGNTLVFKVRCSDLVILNTLTINGFSSANIKGWDGVAIDNARGYLYIAAQAGGVLEILRVALGSFTGGPWLGGFSTLTVCNAAFVFGSYLYLCGGSGDIVGSPAGANWQIYRFNIDVPSSTTLTGLASNVITCYTLDAPHGKAYFGNYENTPGHGRIARVDLATFTIDMTVDFGANSGPVRALAVDDTDTNIYATMAPAAHGGATWWLMKTDLNLASPTFITDATWTGTPPVQGAKLIVFIGPGTTPPPPPPPPPPPSSRVNISNGDTTNINASEALRAPWVNNDGDWIDANAVPQGPTPYASQSFTPGNPGVATLNISAIDGDVTIRGPTYVTQVLIDGVPADAFWCDNSNHSTPLPSTSFRTVWARNPNRGTTMQVTFADTDGSVRAFKVLGPLINDYTTYVGVSNTPNVWEVDLTSDAVVIAAAASPGRIDYPIGYDVSYGTDPNGLHYQRSAVTIAGGGLRDLSWRLKYGTNLTEVFSRFVVYIENDVADGMVENGIKLLAGASNETIPSIGFYPLIVSRFEIGPKSMPNNRGLYKALEYLYDAESGSGFPPLVSMGDAILRAGRWYNIEKRVKLNTGAGIHDGICQCWINGHLVFTDTTRLYRNDNTTPLTEFFVNIYHGGTTPVIADIHFRIAKLAISTSYIGIAPEFQSNYPLWRRNMPTVNQAYSIANTANLNGLSVNTGEEAEPINTWNGLSASDDALFSTACGGHGVVGQQLWRNAVYKFDLSPDVPAWTLEHAGSTVITINPANPANWGVPYYTDLLPGARHSYSSSQFIKARNRAMLFAGAAYWQDGNSLSGAVSGFNPTTKLWDAAGTWASCPIAHIAMAVTKHPVTEDVYVDKVGLIYKWDQVANSWSQFVPAGGADPWSGDFCPLLIDVNGVRNRLMSFGPHGGDPTGIFLFDLTSRVLTVVHMTGALGGFEPYSTMVHDLDNDRYLTVQGTGLFAIDPNTWVATIVCTVPRPAPGTDEYGTQNKLAYFQKYGGVAYVSEFAANVTFVPTR